MKKIYFFLLLSLLPILSSLKGADSAAAIESILKTASPYTLGSPRKPWVDLENAFRKGDPATRSGIEKLLVEFIKNPSTTTDAKNQALLILEVHGSFESVPALIEFSKDPTLESNALIALEQLSIGRPDIGALAANLKPTTVGAWRILIRSNSPEILKKASAQISGENIKLGQALLQALALSGTPESAEALKNASAPEPLLRERDQALVDCAAQMMKNGKPENSLELYRYLQEKSKFPEVQVAATSMLLISKISDKSSPDSLKQAQSSLLGLLSNSDPKTRKIGTGLISQFPQIDFLTDSFPKMETDVQIAILDGLTLKTSPAIIPLIPPLLKEKTDESLLRVAINAAGRIGDASLVDPLVEKRKSGGDFKSLCENALTMIPDRKANAKIRELWKSSTPDMLKVLMKISSERGDREAIPELFKIATQESNPLAASAWAALAELSTKEDVDPIIKAGIPLEDSSVIGSHKVALATSLKHITDKESVFVSLQEAYKQTADKKSVVSYIYALAQLKLPKSNKFLIEIAKTGSDKAKTESIKELAENPSPELKGDFKDLAKNSTVPTVKIVALRGYIKVLSAENKTPIATRFDDYKEALTLAERPDEQRLLIESIGTIQNTKVEEFLRSLPVLPEVKPDVEKTIEKIGKNDSPKKKKKSA